MNILIIIMTLLISIMSSLFFGKKILIGDYKIDKIHIGEITLYSFIIILSAAISIIGAYNLAPVKSSKIKFIYGEFGFSLIFIVNSIVLLSMLIKYIAKNSSKYVQDNKIYFKRSFIVGAISIFSTFGIISLGIEGMVLLQLLVSLKGIIALVYFVPLILGCVLSNLFHKYMTRFMTNVVRKNLTEKVRGKLVEEQ